MTPHRPRPLCAICADREATTITEWDCESGATRTVVACAPCLAPVPDPIEAFEPADLAAREVDALPCVGATVGFARKDRADHSDEWREIALGERANYGTPRHGWPDRTSSTPASSSCGPTAFPWFSAWTSSAHGARAPAPTCSAPTRSRPTGQKPSTPAPCGASSTSWASPWMPTSAPNPSFGGRRGAGLGSASRRAEAAWLGAWEGGH